MPNPNTYEFYQAYVTNVRDFLLAETEIRRIINRSSKTGKSTTVKVQTKVYALLYSTFSEANFMKMILTPHGFDQNYYEEILRQESIQEKWLKCLELAFIKFKTHSKGSEVPNKILGLRKIIEKYVVDPSILRNKLAHGQLSIALNSKNTNLNPQATNQIQNLDFITVYKWFQINQMLCCIIEDLIESPEKAHYNQYYTKFQELEGFISRSKDWTLESKMQTKSMKRKVPHLTVK